MTKKFVLDLQQHAEFDPEQFRKDFEAEWTDPNESQDETDDQGTDEDLEGETDESETDAEDQEDDQEDTEDSESEDETLEDDENENEKEDFGYQQQQQQAKKPKQSKEDNAAFAEMRRKQEEQATQLQVLEQLAAQYGMTVDQFQKAYADQQEEAEAKAKEVPVDFLREHKQTQTRLDQIEKQTAQDKFYTSVDRVKEKYGLTTDEINNVFSYIGEQGLVNQATNLPLVDFEVAYKAANFDQIQERKIKEAKQADLAAKKKRQKNSAKPHNSSNVSAASNSADDGPTLDEVEKSLKERNLI